MWKNYKEWFQDYKKFLEQAVTICEKADQLLLIHNILAQLNAAFIHYYSCLDYDKKQKNSLLEIIKRKIYLLYDACHFDYAYSKNTTLSLEFQLTDYSHPNLSNPLIKELFDELLQKFNMLLNPHHSLLSLPNEIINKITGYVDDPRDIVHWRGAVRTLYHNFDVYLHTQKIYSNRILITSGKYRAILIYANKIQIYGLDETVKVGFKNQNISQSFYEHVVKQLDKNEYILQVAVGSSHILLLSNKGRVWGHGSNVQSQLGLGELTLCSTFHLIGPHQRIIQIAAAGAHTMLLSDTGHVWCCGDNRYGQLGLDNINVSQREFISLQVIEGILPNERIARVVTTPSCTFLLSNLGRVWVSGANEQGQLGLGSTNSYTHFTLLNIANLGTREYITQIAASSHHTVLLSNQGNLWGCGWNQYGQLGLGDTDRRLSFTKITMLPELNKGECIEQIMAGVYNTVLLTNHQRILTCAYDIYFKPCGALFNLNLLSEKFLLEKEVIIKIVAREADTLLVTNRARILLSELIIDQKEVQETQERINQEYRGAGKTTRKKHRDRAVMNIEAKLPHIRKIFSLFPGTETLQ